MNDEFDNNETNEEELFGNDKYIDEELSDNEVQDIPSNELNTQYYNNYKQNVRRININNNLREKIANNQAKNLFARIRGNEHSQIENEDDENKQEDNNQEKSNSPIKDVLNKKKEEAKSLAKQGAKKAANATVEGAKKLALVLVKNPYFWIFAGIFLLLLLIPILWAAIDNNDSKESSLYGYFDSECDYNLTKVNLLLSDGSYSVQNLSMEDYTIGVAYAEVGEYVYLDGYEEYAKTIMLTAKTFAMKRAGYDKTTKEITLKASTYDQAWCDIYAGCKWYQTGAGAYWYYSQNSGISKSGESIYKQGLNEENLKKAKETYKEIANYILVPKSLDGGVNNSNDIASIEYRDHTQNFWKSKAAQGKTWKEIIDLTGTSDYTSYASNETATRLSKLYQEIKPIQLNSFCKYTAAAGSECSTKTPIELADGADYVITSPYGYRIAPTVGATSNHEGIDLGYPLGTPVYAVSGGTVSTSVLSTSAGNFVVIDHDIDGDGQADYYTEYMHMRDTPLVKVGDTVSGGDQIGVVGSTGYSTGPHLHFGLGKIDENGRKRINPTDTLYGLKDGTSIFNKGSICNVHKYDDFPEYNQCDSKWGSIKICDQADFDGNGICIAGDNICDSGCGYTAFTMIASGITGKKDLTPDKTVPYLAKFSENEFGGAITDSALINPEMLKKYNMKAEVIFARSSTLTTAEKKKKIVEALKKGNPVELLVPGHFIALVKMDGNKIKLNDSGKVSNNGYYTIDELYDLMYKQRNNRKGDTCDSLGSCFVYAVAYSKS